jgi:3D (Asp-Asp-Asp) domain-containing protein
MLRVVGMVFGFWLLIHMMSRESATMADQPTRQELPGNSPLTSLSANGLQDFHATAYCVTGITRSGVAVSPGHVAADPKVIPLGSVIYVDSPHMGGVYQVLDTGRLVKGKIIDIFIPSYERCKEFGRRAVKVKILRYGFLDDTSRKEQNN